jgi:hypothetical protein
MFSANSQDVFLSDVCQILSIKRIIFNLSSWKLQKRQLAVNIIQRG